MDLSDVIRNYRQDHGISMEKFAKDSGISKSYVSMIENRNNPRSGKPVIPSIVTLKKIASGMHTDLDSLISLIDDQPVDLSPRAELTFEESILLQKFRLLNAKGRSNAIEHVDLLASNDSYLKSTQSNLVAGM